MSGCERCGVNPHHGQSSWRALLLAAALLEAVAMRRGNREHTFTHATRSTFRTDTACGRAAFAVCWLATAIWFALHITRSDHNHPTRTP